MVKCVSKEVTVLKTNYSFHPEIRFVFESHKPITKSPVSKHISCKFDIVAKLAHRNTKSLQTYQADGSKRKHNNQPKLNVHFRKKPINVATFRFFFNEFSDSAQLIVE